MIKIKQKDLSKVPYVRIQAPIEQTLREVMQNCFKVGYVSQRSFFLLSSPDGMIRKDEYRKDIKLYEEIDPTKPFYIKDPDVGLWSQGEFFKNDDYYGWGYGFKVGATMKPMIHEFQFKIADNQMCVVFTGAFKEFMDTYLVPEFSIVDLDSALVSWENNSVSYKEFYNNLDEETKDYIDRLKDKPQY